jgi:hypothetical protein
VEIGYNLGRFRRMTARLECGFTSCLGFLSKHSDPCPKQVDFVLERSLLINKWLELLPKTREQFFELP